MIYAAAAPAAMLAGCRRRSALPPTRERAEEQRSRDSGRFLSAEQWDAVEAASGRLIPGDDGPGAREARVVNYIDAQLALPQFSGLRPLFLAGLTRLDQLARGVAGKRFADTPPAKQDAVLRRMERGVPLGKRRGSSRFFRVLLTFTIEGFLCDPVYGGNHDAVGWKLIGFEPRPPRPRHPYRSPT